MDLWLFLTIYIETNETPNFDLELSPFSENEPIRDRGFSGLLLAVYLRTLHIALKYYISLTFSYLIRAFSELSVLGDMMLPIITLSFMIQWS